MSELLCTGDVERRLRERGRADVDESALFAMVGQMREITETAAASTRKARRDRERRNATPVRPVPVPVPPPAPDAESAEAKPPGVTGGESGMAMFKRLKRYKVTRTAAPRSPSS